MRRRTPHAVLLVMLLVATLLAGCGPSSGQLELLALASAPGQTTNEGTARISQEIRVRARGSGEQMSEITAEGIFDLKARRGDITFSLDGRAVRTLIDGTTLYQNFPDFSSQFGGKTWLKVDLAEVAERAGIADAGSAFQGESSDPSAGLDYLSSLGGDITEVGAETVRDVRTTHYRGQVDMVRAVERAPEAQRQAIERLTEQMGVTTIPIEVWLDSAGRVRRLRQTLDYSKARSTEDLPAEFLPGGIDLTIEFFDFGVPFTFTPPPDDEVFDGSALLDQLPRDFDPEVTDPDFDPDVSDPETTDPYDDPDFSEPDEEEPPNPATLALRNRILRSVPDGYQVEADDDGQSGPISLDEAVDNDEDDDAREALTSAGYVAGYLQAWEAAGGEDQEDEEDDFEDFKGILVLLYQFRSTDGARAYGSRLIGQAADELTGSFQVDGIPGARGLASDPSDDESEPPTKVVVMGRGSYVAAVVVYGTDGASPKLVNDLAQQQYRLLAD